MAKESRLKRWSRRKTETQVKDHPEAVTSAHGGALPGVMITDPVLLKPKVDDAQPSEESSEVEAETSVEEAKEPQETGPVNPEDLPDIESLDKDSDFSIFMRDGVPEELQKLALRKLWMSNPIFGFRDGMNDYDEDFNVIDKLISLADTDYKPGKGFMTEEDWAQYEDDDDDVGDGDDEGIEVSEAEPETNGSGNTGARDAENAVEQGEVADDDTADTDKSDEITKV